MRADIQGNYSFELTGGVAKIEIDRVTNPTANSTSGTIRFEFWLSTTPYSGGDIFGYQLASARLDEFPNGGDGQLNYRETYTNIRFSDPYNSIPNGVYYPVVLVSEYSSSRNDFLIVDFGSFNSTLQIGVTTPPPNPDPPPVETIVGTDEGETLPGTFDDDTLMGLGGDDFLIGFSGNDRLFGGSGNDTLSSVDGVNGFFGGPGIDEVAYYNASSGLVASLLNPSLNRGVAAGDTYSSIESLHGTDFDDMITGNNGANTLSGDAGDDVLSGLNGNDILWAGEGSDTLYGGLGNDELWGDGEGVDYNVLIGGAGADEHIGFSENDEARYSDASIGLVIDMITEVNSGIAAGDTFSQIEHVFGSQFNDILRGDNLSNKLTGWNGNDELVSRAGNDTLLGGNGNDTLIGGSGADQHIGGFGFDEARYTDSSIGITVDLQTEVNSGIAAGDTFSGIENLFGSAHRDSLRGDQFNNKLIGWNGNDFLFGRDGNDVIFGSNGSDIMWGGRGRDQMFGGPGFDEVRYTDSTAGLTVDLLTPSNNTWIAAGDSYSNVEAVFGSIHDDRLFGNNANNRISGFFGDDRLIGRGGNDVIVGGDGVDILWGGAGIDTFVFDEGHEVIPPKISGVQK